MSKQIINPSDLAPPRGFSHGILTSGERILFLAGQVGNDASGAIVDPTDLVAQFEQALQNLQAVVVAAGGSMSDVVKLNIFVKDRDDYLAHLKPLGRAYRTYFGDHYPTMALFEINKFFQDEVLVEIEGIAALARDSGREGA